jgi:disulfide bond formation protein DsbB
MNKTTYLITTLMILLALGLAACGGDDGGSERLPQEESSAGAEEAPAAQASGDAAAGQELFMASCVACHGPEGEGVPGLSKDMTASTFIAEKSDDELVAFIKVGRDPSDPLNSTGVAMPPKGGNPAYTDENLFDIVAFVRTLQE